MEERVFCTCTDHQCPNHPINHDQGCTLCIRKNLREGEIPSCFFAAVGGNDQKDRYKYEDFARVVLKKQSEKR